MIDNRPPVAGTVSHRVQAADICYFRDERNIPPERLTLELIDVAAVTGFLTWLRTSRHNSASTCNQRLAAISSFYSWLQSQDPARMACCQDIRVSSPFGGEGGANARG
jgi:site-specific recombinase XerD